MRPHCEPLWYGYVFDESGYIMPFGLDEWGILYCWFFFIHLIQLKLISFVFVCFNSMKNWQVLIEAPRRETRPRHCYCYDYYYWRQKSKSISILIAILNHPTVAITALHKPTWNTRKEKNPRRIIPIINENNRNAIVVFACGWLVGGCCFADRDVFCANKKKIDLISWMYFYVVKLYYTVMYYSHVIIR